MTLNSCSGNKKSPDTSEDLDILANDAIESDTYDGTQEDIQPEITDVQKAEFLWTHENTAVDYAEIFKKHPWLNNRSLWFEHVKSTDPVPDGSHLGDFGTGNGVVFAESGMTLPLNSLHGLMGPGYQTDKDGFFGDVAVVLSDKGGKNIDPDEEWLFRIRETPILLYKAIYSSAKIELFIVDFAPVTENSDISRSIIRLATLKNTGNEPVKNLNMLVKGKGYFKEEKGLYLEKESRRAGVRISGSGSLNIENEIISFEIPEIPPAGEFSSKTVILFGKSEEEIDSASAANGSADAHDLLEKTHDFWNKWISATTIIESPDMMVNDLLDGLKITIKIQMAENGAMVPMSHYSNIWTRDHIGPVRFFCSAGAFDDVKNMLDYLWLAILKKGDISNAYDADYVKTDPLPAQPDWGSKPVFTGRTAAEGPSYIPIMHHLYAKISDDKSMIKDRINLLLRALLAQKIDENGLLPFSGDETFRPQMAGAFGMDLYYSFEDLAFSANSGFLFVAAARILINNYSDLIESGKLEQMKNKLALAENALKKYYFLPEKGFYSPFIVKENMKPFEKPYEDVNVQTYWLGIEDLDQGNMEKTVDALWNEEGTFLSPLDPVYSGTLAPNITEGVQTGMIPGFTLDVLSKLDHPYAEKSFNFLRVAASHSGNFPEVLVFDDHSALMPIYVPEGGIGEMWARFRPWEGGIIGEAIMEYLIGFSVGKNGIAISPHIPNGWTEIIVKNIKQGKNTIDMEIVKSADNVMYHFSLIKGDSVNIKLTHHSGGKKVKEVSVNGKTVQPESFANKWNFTSSAVSFSLSEEDAAVNFIENKAE
jgi:hypothetical protein